MTTVTVQRKLTIPDSRIAEARRDLDMLLNPANLITFNDGYYARSLEQKWGMTAGEMQQIVGKLKIRTSWE